MFDMQMNVHLCELVDDYLNPAIGLILPGMSDIQIDVQFCEYVCVDLVGMLVRITCRTCHVYIFMFMHITAHVYTWRRDDLNRLQHIRQTNGCLVCVFS